MGDTYELRPFTEERLRKVAEEWEALAGADEFQVELSAVFEWCESHLTHKEGDAHALELFNSTRNTTDGIVELVNAQRGTLTKLLKLWVSPDFWAIDPKDPKDAERRDRAVALYASAHVQVIAQGFKAGCDEIKIYGRTNPMLEVLTYIQSIWSTFNTGWIANMQGRWLSFTKSKVTV